MAADLFEKERQESAERPLADRMRPASLDEFAGVEGDRLELHPSGLDLRNIKNIVDQHQQAVSGRFNG